MKKLGFVLFIVSDFILFAIGKKIFDTQYLQFCVLSLLLISVNLLHVWFQAFRKK